MLSVGFFIVFLGLDVHYPNSMVDLSRFEDDSAPKKKLKLLFEPEPRKETEEDLPEELLEDGEIDLSNIASMPGLDTKEGITEQLKTIAQSHNTSPQVRVQALKVLREHLGFAAEKPKVSVGELSDLELEECMKTVVIPALEPFGVREK